MKIELNYGKGKAGVSVPDENIREILSPNSVELELTGIDEVNRALENPIGSGRLKDIVKKGESVCIITSDITRPMPSKLVLPAVLEELYRGGVENHDITVVFALGNHRTHTEDEKKYLVGEEAYSKIRCIDSDRSRILHLGTTSLGTPVDIFEEVVKADRVICLGNIEYHYFAGYSGGAKAIMPGVSSRAAIQANHSRMVQPEAAAGRLDGNPVRDDIDEVARFVPIDFIVNVVLDEHKNIIKSVAGDYLKAHRAGCSFLDEIYKLEIPKPADIVVVSAGGYPKDLNMYQAQKALDNAGHAVREGGIIVWIASCREGLGEKTFEKWMTGHERSEDMITDIRLNFELGGHKAAAIAMVLKKARVLLVSELQPEFVRNLHLEPCATVPEALELAMQITGPGSKILAMPYGGSTLPIIAGK